MNPSTIIIVGGGLAGLSTALVAARAGARVTVLERAPAPGGRATTSTRHGFAFNIGPHALYRRADAILDGLGVTVAGGRPPLDRTIAWRDGRRHVLPLGGALLSTDLLAPADRRDAEALFGSLASIDTRSLQRVTVRDWLDRAVASPAVRGLMEALLRVSSYVDAPVLASAGAHLEHLQDVSQHGVRYIDGGWQSIVDALRALALRAGVQIQTRVRVARVTRHPNGWSVRATDGGERVADAVVLAVAPREASELAPDSAALARWAEDAVPVQAATLDVALSRAPVPTANYSIGIDRPLYLSLHSIAARLAPEQGAVLHAAMYLPPHAPPDAPANLAELESLVDQVQPGWRELVVHRRYLPHVTVTNAVVTAARGGLSGRPGPAVPDARGLFVAGDWVGPIGMLAEAALASGVAAGEVAARVQVDEPDTAVA